MFVAVKKHLVYITIICIIENSETPLFHKGEKSNFWMSTLYFNKIYQGLIIAPTCSFEYCKSEFHQFTPNDLNSQCDHNRAGLVCGACAASYSLILGGSYCQVCSNSYLALILPFALMEIILRLQWNPS